VEKTKSSVKEVPNKEAYLWEKGISPPGKEFLGKRTTTYDAGFGEVIRVLGGEDAEKKG